MDTATTAINNSRFFSFFKLLSMQNLLSLLILFAAGGSALAHNLGQIDTMLAFDKTTIDLMKSRAGSGLPMLRLGDRVGVILKSTPGPGTATGAGGYMTFYIPPGTQVKKAEYGYMDGSGGFVAIPMKGPAIIATGDGSVGSATTPGLIGSTLPAIPGIGIVGLNASGVQSTPVSATGVHNGTIAGVYGDTGIFYSTDPATVWQSFVNSGGYDGNLGTADNILTNNRGISKTPITRWDAEQLIAFGLSSPAAPVLDPNGRGNTPWGMGSAVAGPQSGYAWAFSRSAYQATGDMKQSIVVGPWKRIQYPGSSISKDQPGLKSTALGYTVSDASNMGVAITSLPPTLNLTDSTSPKAIRFSEGALILGQPEYGHVELEILADVGQPNSPFDANGCFTMNTDAFGGDAGGEQGGKDHLWRYYDPTVQAVNPCSMIQKVFAKTPLAPGENSYFDLAVINTGTSDLTDAIVTDPMPSGIAYLSASPAPTSTSPLTWNLGTIPVNGVKTIRVNFTATGTGTVFNTATLSAKRNGTPLTTSGMDSVDIGVRSLLRPDKTVTPSSVAPGGSVTYTMVIKNDGTGNNGTPLVISEVLPPGFTYASYVSAQINGGAVAPGIVTVNSANPAVPIFTISQGILPGKNLTVVFNVLVSSTQPAGVYTNTLSLNYEGKVTTSGQLAPVTVGGGRIGDTIFRDWNGNGTQDSGEEGLSGVTVTLTYLGANGVLGGGDDVVTTKVTDASGAYLFTGLAAGNYQISVPAPGSSGVPTGYTLTADPDGGAATLTSNKTLALNEVYLGADWGYRPGGTASIGDKVFKDLANDGIFNGGDTGIGSVTVNLYKDTNGNGVINAGDTLIATTTTSGSGDYSFTGLAAGLSYIVDVDQADSDIAAVFGVNPFQSSTTDPHPVTNLTGAYTAADFGFWQSQPGSIGDKFFQDTNSNGVFDAGDVGMPGVTVNLYRDLNGNGAIDSGEFVTSTTTNASGDYLFSGLGPNSYLVSFNSADPAISSGYSSSVSIIPVSLTAGQNVLTADFPFTRLINKTVDKAFVQAGQTLTFGINVDYAGGAMLQDATVRDFIPIGTTFLSAQQGGGLVTFSSLAGTPSSDAGSGGNGTVTVSAQADIKDTWLDENSPASNFGSTDNIHVDSRSGQAERALVKFTLPAGIPDDAVVTSATLKLTKLSGNTIDVIAHQADNPWNELQANWTNYLTGTAWDTPGGDYIEDALDPVVSSGAATGDRTWSVAHIVQNWLDGQSNNGFLLKAPLENTGANSNIFASSAHATAGSRPTLTFTYTSTARPATTNTITVSPTVVAPGSPVTVTMTVQASSAVANVVPSSLGITGGSATVSGPTPASRNLVGGTPATFTWTVTPTSVAEFTFSASAGNGTVNILPATSNSMLASPGAQSQYVAWNLGDTDPGTTGVTSLTKNLYAFRGADALSFWTHNTVNATWNNTIDPTDTPAGVTVKEGGALTNDGVRYIYALRGDWTRVFLRYDTATDTWSDAAVADLPNTTSNPLWKGGALVHLNGFVYAFLGDDSRQLWRYSVSGNSWTRMTDALGTVNTGAGLTTDGTNIFATQGDGKKGFWRYNVAANTWTALTPFADNISDGGCLTYANGAIYVLRGAAQTTFRRYNIASNNWTTLAATPGVIDDGGAMAYDGTRIYALAGKSNRFYSYNISTNAWTTQPTTPANIGWGGALTFLAVGNVSQTVASASPTFITGVSQVAVQMTVTSDDVINNIAAVAPTFTATGGITATFGSPTLVSPNDDISGTGDPVIYRWIATVTPGASPGEITFTTNSSLGGAANTNSVIASQDLTYVATVSASPPALIENTAYVGDYSGGLPPTPSNTTQTATGGSLGDYVWADLNGNGAQNSGEPGLAGIRVFIDQNANGSYDIGEPNDITDGAGAYRIFGLTAGTYAASLDLSTLPLGYSPTTQSTLSAVLALNSTQLNTVDYGLRPPPAVPSSIGDTLWIDANENGAVDSGETLLANITVRLYNDINNNGAIDAGDILLGTTSTNASGQYQFSNLHAGNYLVDVLEADVDMPGGLELVTGGANVNALQDVTLGTGQTYTTADFGYNYSGKIGDTIFYDTNGDGTQNGIEGVAQGAVISLFNDVNNNGKFNPGIDTVVGVTSSNVSGLYLFDNLPPGNYIVVSEEQTVPAPPGSANAGLVGYMVATNGTKHAVTLTTVAMTNLNVDIGFIEAAEVEGHVFHDVNNNGVLDPGEPRLPNVTVTLTGTDILGSPVSLTTVSDATGEYAFLPLGGTYTVAYNTADTDIPAGLIQATTASTYTISVASGEEVENLDFGRDNAGVIGDTVFNDADGNGSQNAGELGLSNVTVLLLNAAGTVTLDTTVTDSLGRYYFRGLADATYKVQVLTSSLPSGYGTTPTADPDALKDSIGTATVTGGGSVLTMDFGYKVPTPTFSLSGNVWDDNGAGGGVAGNGTKAGTEPGLTTVTVTAAVDTNGDSIVDQTLTTTTDASGNYTFAGIPQNSNVTVTVSTGTLPNAAYVQTGDPDVTLDNKTTITNIIANVTGQNFGYNQSFGSIAGKFVVGNGNGIADPLEPGLSAVTITLTYAGLDGFLGTGDDTTQTTTTALLTGAYSFSNLLPGAYQISKVTNTPAGYASLADSDGTNPDLISTSLTVGQNLTAQDFEARTVLITGTVWRDADGSANNTFTNIRTGLEAGANPGGLVAILVDGSGNVVQNNTVAANGTYQFSAVPPSADYTIRLATTAGTIGQPAPAAGLPATWVNTSPLAYTPFAVATTDVTGKDFGIEQPPTANAVTAAAQANPGGATKVTVSTLSGTDPEDPSVTTFIIKTLPANGTLYYNNIAVTAGQTIASYDSTKLTVDPNDGTVTVSFTYTAVDAAGRESTAATVTMPFNALNISGTVFNDANGLLGTPLNTVDGTGTNVTGLLFANLVTGGLVAQKTAVANDGTYSFANVLANTTYTVVLSTTEGTVGNAPPAAALPAGWVNTGEFIGLTAGNDGTADGSLSVPVVTTSRIDADFGIEQLPTANAVTAASQANPGGTTKVTVPTLTGSDPEDQPVSGPLTAPFNNIVVTVLPTNGTLYYNGNPVVLNTPFAVADPALLKLDPNDGSITATFDYKVIDAAGRQSATATVTMPFTALNISGTVFNDANGLLGTPLNTVDGTGTNAGNTLFANLVTGGLVAQKTAVANDGTYSFANVLANTTYTVVLSTTEGTIGIAPPAAALPAGWVNTGEFIGLTAGNDGTADGSLSVPVVTTSRIDADFGIEQLPTANAVTALAQANPGGTTKVTVPTLTGSDPEDQPVSGNLTAPFNNIVVTVLPTNGTLYYDGNPVVLNTPFAIVDPALLKLDPNDGSITTTFDYKVIDAAGRESAAATVTMPFTALNISGTVFNDANGLLGTPANTVDGTGTNVTNQLFASLVNAGFVAQTVAVANDGTYSFANVSANTTYTVVLSTTNYAPLTTAAAALPVGWVNTGEFIGLTAGSDGTADGNLSVPVVTSSVINADFGIEQPPTADAVTATSQANPGGTTKVTVPTLTGSDPEDQPVSGPLTAPFNNIVVTVLPTNGTLYYNNVPVVVNTPFTVADPALLKLDPNDGSITATFDYKVIDAAGKQSATATVTMPFTGLNISGTVFNDANGLLGTPLNTVDGVVTNAGNSLFANLVTGGLVAQKTAVANDGTYSFANVLANTTYTVVLSTTEGTVGNAPPAAALPAGWVNTGEFIGLTAGNDGTAEGSLSVPVVTTSRINANFGIEQPPTANAVTAASQLNPGGTVQVVVPTLSGTDSEDPTVTKFIINGPATNGTLYYNGTPVTTSQTITGFNPALLTVDPASGSVTVSFNYTVEDAAGVVSAPATVTLPFITGTLVISGQVRKDLDGDGNLAEVTDPGIGNVLVSLYSDPNGNGDHLDDGSVLATTYTNSGGNYQFTSLPAGNYVVVETNPAGAISTADAIGNGEAGVSNDDKIPVVLVATNVTGRDFLDKDVPVYAISGFVYNDGATVPNDFSPDDTAIQAVLITLYRDTNGDGLADVGEPAIGTTFTNALGAYSFPNLIAGDYVVKETTPYLATNLNDTDTLPPGSATDGVIGVTLVAANVVDQNFLNGGIQLAKISGQVRNDTNGDGNLADPDAGIPGVTVTVFTDPNGDGDPSDGMAVVSTVTDLNGNYVTPLLPQGNYVVVETDPAGATSTNDAASSGALTPTGIDNRIPVGLLGTDVGGCDFLDTNPTLAGISGTVYNDGVTTPGSISVDDIKLPGVTVKLYADANNSGLFDGGDVLLGMATTDMLGAYQFPGLSSGNYLVVETDPAGATSVYDVQGVTTDNTIAVPLAALNVTGRDFLDATATLTQVSGQVRNDTNGDGNPADPDAGVPGVTISLYSDPNGDGDPSDGVLLGTTTTNSSGDYSFVNLTNSTYVIVETDPAGATSTYDVTGSLTDNRIPVTTAGVAITGRDFLDQFPTLASISGSVFLDGVTSPNVISLDDIGLPGVTVKLYGDTNGNGLLDLGEALIATTATNTSGDYTFPGLAAGNYVIVETDPFGATSVFDVQGPVADNMIGVTLAATNVIDRDFLDSGITLHSIAGSVFRSPALTGVPAVTVSLYTDPDGDGDPSDGALVTTTATNSTGAYIFTGLPDAKYVVIETNPVGATDVSDVDGANDNRVRANLSGANITDRDFVDSFPALYSLSGRTMDGPAGNTSLTNPANRSLGGVRIELYSDLNNNAAIEPGEPLIDTRITDANGNYTFTGLPNGNYLLKAVNPVPSAPANDKDGWVTPNLISATISGADNLNNDFLQAVDPAGYIYDPVTGKIVTGGSISVTGPGSVNIVESGVTGQYSFILADPVTAGTYTMLVTPPAGYELDISRLPLPGPYNPPNAPGTISLGSPESVVTPGYLQDYTAGTNQYYFTFDLSPGDQYVINNNIPVVPIVPVDYPHWDYKYEPPVSCFPKLLQFAFGLSKTSSILSPTLTTDSPFKLVKVADVTKPAGYRVDAQVRQIIGLTTATISLEYIASLASSGPGGAGWSSYTTAPTTRVPNGDGTEIATYQDVETLLGLTSGQGFVRVKVTDTAPVATARTAAAGWSRRTAIKDLCQTFSMPYLDNKLFCGKVDSATSSSLNVATSVGPVSIKAAMLATPGRSYYVEVTSGTYAGQRFEVDEANSTATTIALVASDPLNTVSPIPALAAGDFIGLHTHWTLGELFDVNAFNADADSTKADKVKFFNTTTQTFQNYSLLPLGPNGWVLDGTGVDASSRLMDPSEGCFVTAKFANVDQLFVGVVRGSPFATPLKAGYNLIGGGWPMNQSAAAPNTGRAMTPSNGFTGFTNPAQSDIIQIWKTDTSGVNTDGYSSDYLLNYGGYNQWTRIGDTSLPNNNIAELFKALRAAMFRSLNVRSNYVAPLPWTP